MRSDQFIVFFLNGEEYGLPIANVQEVLRLKKRIKKIPNMPYYVEGIIDLRGHVVTVVNLCKRFGFETQSSESDPKLIIADLGNMMVALLVDDVSDIISFEESQMEKLEESISSLGKNSILGIGHLEERMIILLDARALNLEIFENTDEGENAC